MPRKKKFSKKIIPMNSFRYNYSPSAKGHPQYVFGEKNNKYKSLGITHTPNKKYKYTKLTSNPNFDDRRDSYLQHKVQTTNKKYFSGPLLNWKFNKKDLPLVRYLKKRYKKRNNKKRR